MFPLLGGGCFPVLSTSDFFLDPVAFVADFFSSLAALGFGCALPFDLDFDDLLDFVSSATFLDLDLDFDDLCDFLDLDLKPICDAVFDYLAATDCLFDWCCDCEWRWLFPKSTSSSCLR